jgi:hypothetical protein
MPQLPFNIGEMLSAGRIRRQVRKASRGLGRFLGDDESAHGRAYDACHAWQRRFEQALRSEIPDWAGLAGFRCITDFTIPPRYQENVDAIFPKSKPGPAKKPPIPFPETIDTHELIWHAYDLFKEGQAPHAGKINLAGDAEDHWRKNLHRCFKVLGGQAGNILWLWHCIQRKAIAYVPYLSKKVMEFDHELPDIEITKFQDGNIIHRRLGEATDLTGMREKNTKQPVSAPSGGSVIVFGGGQRLIYMFKGMIDLDIKSPEEMPWDRVRFVDDANDWEMILEREASDMKWPQINLFCDCYIDDKTLVIRLINEEELKEAFGEVDFAILGGMDSIFFDKWLTKQPSLSTYLRGVAKRQLKALRSCGVRIGVELSRAPGVEYALFLQELCREGLVVAAGINGIDELPDLVHKNWRDGNGLNDLWLNPEEMRRSGYNNEILAEAQKTAKKTKAEAKSSGRYFEYVTYLRAKKLAEALGVRTLYVHTVTLDFILRRDADPGALLHAQLGDMMGKGLVIAALLKRAYGKGWFEHLNERMPPAVKPEAMAKLAQFARDFEAYEHVPGAEDRLFRSGYWLAPARDQYSLAVVPVMWPDVSEAELPSDLNPTGSGDMTFGAFFFLGGV